MSSITDEERERALETGTFEGVSLDEGYYVPVSIEMTPVGAFRVVFSEHGKFSRELIKLLSSPGMTRYTHGHIFEALCPQVP